MSNKKLKYITKNPSIRSGANHNEGPTNLETETNDQVAGEGKKGTIPGDFD